MTTTSSWGMFGQHLSIIVPPTLNSITRPKDLRGLVNSKLFSDCRFQVQDEMVYAHRAVLATRSEYFRQMFLQAQQKPTTDNDKPIQMPGVSHAAFMCIMYYLYTNSFDSAQPPKVLTELIRAPTPPLGIQSENLRSLLDLQLFVDCSFEVGGQVVRGHRAVLATRSGYFHEIFCDGPLARHHEKAIKIADIGHAAFVCIMYFIYTNSFDEGQPPSVLLELVRADPRFMIDGLRELSESRLDELISVDNVIEVYRDAKENIPGIQSVINKTTEYISGHLKAISKSAAFAELPQPLMLEVIQMALDRINL